MIDKARAPFIIRRVATTLALSVTMRASAISANTNEPAAFAIDGRSDSQPAADRSKPRSVRYSGSSVSKTHAAQLIQKKIEGDAPDMCREQQCFPSNRKRHAIIAP